MIYEESRWPKQQNKVNEALHWFEDVCEELNSQFVNRGRWDGFNIKLISFIN